MGDDMGCLKGGAHDYQWNEESKGQVCSKCGRVAPFQPVSYEELLIENAELNEEIAKLECLLQQTHRI